VKGLIRKNKVFTLISIIVIATVLGAAIFSVSASESEKDEGEKAFPCWRFANSWLDDLTEEQKEKLKEMIEENRAQIEQNRDEIKSQLEDWGIEIPEPKIPENFLNELTEEQKEELETMKNEFQDALTSKLEEWGIEISEFGPPKGFGTKFGRNGCRKFFPFRP
jgi:hypothetical protein